MKKTKCKLWRVTLLVTDRPVAGERLLPRRDIVGAVERRLDLPAGLSVCHLSAERVRLCERCYEPLMPKDTMSQKFCDDCWADREVERAFGKA